MTTTADEFREDTAPAGVSPECAVDPRITRSRARLMAAARAILVEQGPSALTVDAVAERSGVAKSTLYRHWPSRSALVLDVLRESMPCVVPLDPTAGFEHRLRSYVRAVAATLVDSEWAGMLPALIALRRDVPEIDALTEVDRQDKTAALTALLDQGVAEGLIPPGLDIQAVVTTLVGPPLMAALLDEPHRVLEAADFALDRFFDSYRCAPPAA